MPITNQKGFSQIIIVMLLLAGIALTTYLVQIRQVFRSQAISEPINQKTIQARIGDASSDAMQVGPLLNTGGSVVWFGSGPDKRQYLMGLRFSNLDIPSGALIKSATLQVRSPQIQETRKNGDRRFSVSIAAEAVANSSNFSKTGLISARLLTQSKVGYLSSEDWKEDKWYSSPDLSPVIQEVINRLDWKPGNALSLIATNTGPTGNRKYFTSFEQSASNSARLIIKYYNP